MSTISAILTPSPDGTLHLPLPAGWRSGRVKVVAQVDLLSETQDQAMETDQPKELLEIMERIARRNPFKGIKDPVAWQREMREDVVLPWPNQS
ncbi:MAG: hypothetical protein U0984_04755 [Prosthecobacter sp.]|nr:hypothetical protein [Prosthecobacter sp.]